MHLQPDYTDKSILHVKHVRGCSAVAPSTRGFGIVGVTPKIAKCGLRIAELKRLDSSVFCFSPFAIRLSQFLYWCLPKNQGRHGGLLLRGYVPMNMVRDEDIGQTNRRGNPERLRIAKKMRKRYDGWLRLGWQSDGIRAKIKYRKHVQ
jgi:hypothetical protein